MKKIIAAFVAVLMMLASAVPVGAQPSPAQAGGSIPRIADITPVQNGVRIRFTAFDGAYQYRVFYKKADGSGWKGIGDTTALTFTRVGIKPYTTDTYTVRALDAQGRFCSSFDPVGCRYTYLPAPTLRKAESVCGGVKITWDPDLNEDGQQWRVYTIKGAAELTDEFTAPTNSASRFFKVEVSLP